MQVQGPTSYDGGRSFGLGHGFIPLERAVSNNSCPGNFSAADDDWKDSDVPSFSVNGQRSGDFSGEGGGRGVRGGCSRGGGFRRQNSDENGRGFKTRESGKLFLFLYNTVRPSTKQP